MDHLHKRRLIIFFINVAGFYACGKMYRFVFRPERKAHSKADTLAGYRSFR